MEKVLSLNIFNNLKLEVINDGIEGYKCFLYNTNYKNKFLSVICSPKELAKRLININYDSEYSISIGLNDYIRLIFDYKEKDKLIHVCLYFKDRWFYETILKKDIYPMNYLDNLSKEILKLYNEYIEFKKIDKIEDITTLFKGFNFENICVYSSIQNLINNNDEAIFRNRGFKIKTSITNCNLLLFKINDNYLYIKVEKDNNGSGSNPCVIYKQLFKIIKYNDKAYLSYIKCEDYIFNILDIIYEIRFSIKSLNINFSEKDNTFTIIKY